MTDATLALMDDTVHTVVDIGTGDGIYANGILQQKPHLKITGFDPATEVIKSAAKKHPHISLLTGHILNISTLPPPHAQVKSSILGLSEVFLHHLGNP
jgi:trans-aconitate methyltransferase